MPRGHSTFVHTCLLIQQVFTSVFTEDLLRARPCWAPGERLVCLEGERKHASQRPRLHHGQGPTCMVSGCPGRASPVLSCRAGGPRSSECRGSPATLPAFSSSSELTCPPDRAPGHGSCVPDAALSPPWPTVSSAHRPAPPSGAWSVLTGFVLFHWFSSAALAAETEPRLSAWPLPTQATCWAVPRILPRFSS